MVMPVVNTGIRPHRKASVVDGVHDGKLTDADFRGCRWIEGDPSPLRHGMFCGLPAASGESWCAEHRAIVFGEDLATDFPAHGRAGGSAVAGQNRHSVVFGPVSNSHER